MANLKYSIEAPRYNLPATTPVTFGFSSTCQAAQVFSLPESSSRIYGRWNSSSVTNLLWDFYLDAGDAIQSHEFMAISAIALYTSIMQNYASNFNIKGY